MMLRCLKKKPIIKVLVWDRLVALLEVQATGILVENLVAPMRPIVP
jgi:hypothetical protein